MKINLLFIHMLACLLFCSRNTNVYIKALDKQQNIKSLNADDTLSFSMRILLKKFDKMQSWSYYHLNKHTNRVEDKNEVLRHSIDSIFYHIKLKPSLAIPKTLEFSIFKILDDSSACTFGSTSMNNYKIRFPNIGEMECYFQCEELPIINFQLKSSVYHHDCKEYGNIVLINIRSRKAKIINVYNQFNSEEGSHTRYFYLEKNIINIYQEDDYESDVSLGKIYSIKIKDFENIIVSKFNNIMKP